MKKKLRKDKRKMIYDDKKAGPGKRQFEIEEYGITVVYNTDVWDNLELKKLVRHELAKGTILNKYFEREIDEDLIMFTKGDL